MNHLWSFVRTRFRAIQGDGPKRNFRKLRDDPHSNRPSARAQRACESPAAIVQSRRLAADDALPALALLHISVLVLRPFLFSDALAPLLPHAVLDALWSLALPVPKNDSQAGALLRLSGGDNFRTSSAVCRLWTPLGFSGPSHLTSRPSCTL